MNILCTKIIADKELQLYQKKGCFIHCKPFTKQVAKPFILDKQMIDASQGLIITSASTLDFLSPLLQQKLIHSNKLIFCISEKTRKKINQLGFSNLISAPHSLGLAKKIIQSKVSKVLHLGSEQSLDTLLRVLTAHHIHYQHLALYQTISQKVRIEIDNFDAVFFFSPSGVLSYASQYPFQKSVQYVCIGTTTFRALVAYNPLLSTVSVAKKPNLKEMIRALGLL